MKKTKLLFLSALAGALVLSGCGGNGDNGGNNSAGNNSGGNSGGDTIPEEFDTILDELKYIAKGIASEIFEIEKSEVTFGEFEDEDAEADVYYYDSSSLTFVDIEIYSDEFLEDLADDLEDFLPDDAELEENNDFLDYADYGMYYYDRYYSDGKFIYNIYVEAFEEYDWGDGDVDPAETCGSIYIYPESQSSAFDNYWDED